VANSEPLLLSIDLGTTSCKATLFKLDGNRVAGNQAGYPLYAPEPGAAEQDPGDWHAAVWQTLSQLFNAQPNAMQGVIGIGLTAQMNALVPVDEDFTPLGRATCSIDQRPVAYCRKLRQEYSSQLPGIYIGRNSMLGRLLWLREQQPQRFMACAQFTDARGLLCYWLTGETGNDPSFGVWSWLPELLEILRLSLDRLPPIYQAWHLIGRLRSEIAVQFGLPAGVPVVVGSGDGVCANLGVGASALGDGCISLGTTGVARVVVSQPVPAEASLPTFSYPFMDGLWMGGGYYPAGAYLQWLGHLLQPEGYGKAEWSWLMEYLPLAERIPPGAGGLMFLPFIFDRGSGGVEGLAALAGLHFSHQAGHLLRAILEGTAVALRSVADYLSSLGQPINQWRATGGGMAIPLWQQIISGIFGQSFGLTKGDASLGAAMLAAIGVGVYPNLREATRAMVNVVQQVPLPEVDVKAYTSLYERYQAMTLLSPTVSPTLRKDAIERRME